MLYFHRRFTAERALKLLIVAGLLVPTKRAQDLQSEVVFRHVAIRNGVMHILSTSSLIIKVEPK